MQQWNEIFRKRGRVFHRAQEDMPKIFKLLKEKKERKVLDLGCGTGRHIVYFAKRGFDVYGIDISPQAIKLTKSWLKKGGLKAHLRIGSIYSRLPYKSNFFDGVIGIQTVHHSRIENIRKLIKEIERVLKPNGLLFIVVPRKKTLKQYRMESRLIASRTYLPTEGLEKGLVHYLYNKELLRKDFKNFKLHDIWMDSAHHYCLLGELKK